jgi:hypothetical protein
MIRSTVNKVVWMARATTVVVGLAIMLGLIFGVATSAFGANGGNFILGSLNNTATAITKLTGTVSGGPALQVSNPSTATGSTALDLQVATGKAPMKVNRTTKVANLNADKLDGKNATQLGVNGLQIVVANSLFNSSSPKGATATCPAGKVVVGAGYDISGGTSGDPGNEVIDVVPDALLPGSTTVTAVAREGKPSDLNWGVQAYANCATAP